MLNSLVCLASQLSKELANIDDFLPVRELGTPSAAKETVSDGLLSVVTSVKCAAIQKLAK